MWLLEHRPAGEEWSKEFASKEEACAELRSHICAACLAGGEWEDFDENGKTIGIVNIQVPPNPNDIGELLSTPCGCEYDLTEE